MKFEFNWIIDRAMYNWYKILEPRTIVTQSVMKSIVMYSAAAISSSTIVDAENSADVPSLNSEQSCLGEVHFSSDFLL